MAYMHEELLMTAGEFLSWATDQEGLHELIAGQLYRVPDRDARYFRVLVNVTTVLKRHLRRDEASFIRGQAVQVDDDNVILPDVMVAGRLDPRKQPHLIVEIVASRSRVSDVHRRSLAVRRLPSLREQVIVDMDRREVDVRHRDGEGVWTTKTFRIGETMVLTPGQIPLDVADVFKGLDQDDPSLTLREFLAWNADEPVRHEFHKGAIITMAGTTVNHNRVVQGINFQLMAQMRATHCDVFVIDVKLNVEGVPGSYLPDLCVACDPQDLTNDDAIERPLLLIEVLSRSTRAYDRTVKRRSYLQIPTLMEYVLVDYLARRIDVHRRGADGSWSLHQLIGDAPLELKSVALVIPAEEVYRRVRFADATRLTPERPTPVAPIAERWLIRLEELRQLEPGWDGESSHAIGTGALDGARTLLRRRPDLATDCTIFPTREGGIEIEFIRGGWDLSASFSSEGEVEIFGVEQHGDGELRPQAFDEVNTEMLNRLAPFLGTAQ